MLQKVRSMQEANAFFFFFFRVRYLFISLHNGTKEAKT